MTPSGLYRRSDSGKSFYNTTNFKLFTKNKVMCIFKLSLVDKPHLDIYNSAEAAAE